MAKARKERATSYLGEFLHVVHISTARGATRCERCSESIENLADAINHCINAHGYKLIHVGTETAVDDVEGTPTPIHATVAVLGSDKKPPRRKKSEFDQFLDENK